MREDGKDHENTQLLLIQLYLPNGYPYSLSDGSVSQVIENFKDIDRNEDRARLVVDNHLNRIRKFNGDEFLNENQIL
jgi:hypothetical protein